MWYSLGSWESMATWSLAPTSSSRRPATPPARTAWTLCCFLLNYSHLFMYFMLTQRRTQHFFVHDLQSSFVTGWLARFAPCLMDENFVIKLFVRVFHIADYGFCVIYHFITTHFWHCLSIFCESKFVIFTFFCLELSRRVFSPQLIISLEARRFCGWNTKPDDDIKF